MDNLFKEFLPDPSEKSKKDDPELVMKELSDSLNAMYSDRIIGLIASTSDVNDGSTILSYTFYLVFKRHDNFSYPLFNASCKEQNGSYPLQVTSHYGPPVDHGLVNNYTEFESVIKSILKEPRTRNIILSMY